MAELVVLGGGVVGVTTALLLQEWAPSARLTLVADKLTQETTSDGAAGIFRPSNSFAGPDFTTTKRWIDDSYSYYSNLLGQNCGVSEISGYIFSKIDAKLVRNCYLEGLVKEYRGVTPSELELCPGGWKYGSYFSTLLIECRSYLPWAMKRLERGGAVVQKRRVEDLREFEGQCDVLVNCSGLGAQQLCKDTSLVPIRGQVFKVYAPWLDSFYYGDYDTYIVPGGEGIATVGGSRHYESYSTSVCEYDGGAMEARATALLPRLATAPVLRRWVGLRPHRPMVRVELHNINSLKVVHNYGHGGYGVTSAPGTAVHAVKLVQQALSCRSHL